MLTTKNITSTGTKGKYKALTSREEDQQKISMMMIDTYSSPVTPIREVVVNALEAKKRNPVTIDFTTNHVIEKKNIFNNKKVVKSGNITITDDGDGMTRDFVENFLFRMGASTKDDDENATGGFGIGAKSVFSITNNATWTTTHDGETTVAIVSRSGDGFDAIFETFKSDKANGTSVTIPVEAERYTNIIDRIHDEYFNFVSPKDLVMTVDGNQVEIGKYNVSDMEKHEIRLIDAELRPETIVILSNSEVPYFYSLEGTGIEMRDVSRQLFDYHESFKPIAIGNCDYTPVIRMDIHDHVIPNRESLKRSEYLTNKLIDICVEAYKSEVDDYLQTITSAHDATGWRKALDSVHDSIGSCGSLVSRYVDASDFLFKGTDRISPNMKRVINRKSTFSVITHEEYRTVLSERLDRKLVNNIYGNYSFLLGYPSKNSVKIEHWVESGALEGFNLDYVIALPDNVTTIFETDEEGKEIELFDYKKDFNEKTSAKNLVHLAKKLSAPDFLIKDIQNGNIETFKDLLTFITGVKDLRVGSKLRDQAMKEGGKILSELRKSGKVEEPKANMPVHPITVYNQDGEDVWFKTVRDFISWVEETGVTDILCIDQSTYGFDYFLGHQDLPEGIKKVRKELIKQGFAYVYAPGRKIENTYDRIVTSLKKHNEKRDSDIDVSVFCPQEGTIGDPNDSGSYYIAMKLGVTPRYLKEKIPFSRPYNARYSYGNDLHYTKDIVALLDTVDFDGEKTLLDVFFERTPKVDRDFIEQLCDMASSIYPDQLPSGVRAGYVKPGSPDNYNLMSGALMNLVPRESKDTFFFLKKLMLEKSTSSIHSRTDEIGQFAEVLSKLDKFNELIENNL